MSVRTPKGDNTRQRILTAASDLFHKQGVLATSPDEVIEASGTGKGQFYYYFKNKEDLVHQVLVSYREAMQNDTGPLNFRIDSWADLERWFNTPAEIQKRFSMSRGCPLGTIGIEVTQADEQIRQDLVRIFEIGEEKLARFFVKEKARGRLDPSARAEVLADFCLATIQGAMLLGKVKRSSELVQTVVREAFAHLRRYARSPVSHGGNCPACKHNSNSKAPRSAVDEL